MYTNKGMDKEGMVYIYNGILPSHIKENNKLISFAATWMDLKLNILSEASQRNINIT